MTGFHIERDDASAAFFDAASEGRLVIKRCPACGRLYPPAQERCPDSDELEWVDASGAGTLVTWAIDEGSTVSPLLTVADGTGAVIAVVELDEGPWMNAAIPGVDPTTLRDGMAVRVDFLDLGAGEPVPVFRPAGGRD
jgi:uncharacterized OB-fold protein